jgi:hypothetical protein
MIEPVSNVDRLEYVAELGQDGGYTLHVIPSNVNTGRWKRLMGSESHDFSNLRDSALPEFAHDATIRAIKKYGIDLVKPGSGKLWTARDQGKLSRMKLTSREVLKQPSDAAVNLKGVRYDPEEHDLGTEAERGTYIRPGATVALMPGIEGFDRDFYPSVVMEGGPIGESNYMVLIDAARRDRPYRKIDHINLGQMTPYNLTINTPGTDPVWIGLHPNYWTKPDSVREVPVGRWDEGVTAFVNELRHNRSVRHRKGIGYFVNEIAEKVGGIHNQDARDCIGATLVGFSNDPGYVNPFIRNDQLDIANNKSLEVAESIMRPEAFKEVTGPPPGI